MFKTLLGFRKGKDFLTQVLDSFDTMLFDTRTMFASSYGNLFEEEEAPGLKDDIYEIDRRVNSIEKDIRRMVINHLALQPTVDTPTCLILMSVVKDAERLGDFAKNLLEVRSLLEKPLDREIYSSLFKKMDEDILKLFDMTRDAFIDSDEEQAKNTWEYQRRIKMRCNDIIFKAARSTLSTNEAVCLALLARYFKRICSHLTNIATSVIVPLDNLDYFYEETSDE
ncbi:phosphate uptake regulator PhoU [Nitrospirota bacterium]